MILKQLNSKNLIDCKDFVIDNCQYLTITGSVAYGVKKSSSDIDIYGFCIPPKEHLFPHLKGEIRGFDEKQNIFEQWQKHHIKDGKEEYDITVFNIAKFFRLCMNNNPNMIDCLFTPLSCVHHITNIGQIV
ncbi:MAG: DNA polymerase beta superfamily protein, partial [Bacillota bacterium]